MERDLNFTVTDGRRDDSVRVNGGISEYAEVRSRTAELFRRPGIRVTAALLCCLLWGSAFPCVKMGYEMLNITDTGSQILFAGYRFVLAGIFTFLAGCLIEKRALLPRKTALPAVAGQAMLQTALQYVFFYVGMAHTTGIKGSVINSSDVFFAMFAAHFLIRGERVTWRKIIGRHNRFCRRVFRESSAGRLGQRLRLSGGRNDRSQLCDVRCQLCNAETDRRS